ncbi:MAG: hypothetical protein EPO20_14645 [Betaproteobacteria bacterium]|nr:MAG: hypothetical protein EPO20_14645 [Betaproteobacteria bacterium]
MIFSTAADGSKETTMEVIPGSVVSNGNGARPPVGNGKDTKGRKDGGHEQVPNAPELMKSLPRLKGLLADKEAASAAYNKAKKAAAKKCGFQADVVHVAVKAFSGEKEDLELQTRRAEQLSLAFEAIAAAA